MLVVGRQVIPWLLHYVAHTGSRELFRLAVLAIALGVAFGAAHLFGVSFALGAFFAGMVLAESELSQQAARETLPLRDAFAVLFFVSVGMLFNPAMLVTEPLAVLATFADHRGRQVGGGLPDRARLRPFQPGGADHRRQPGPDRRVLLHPGGAGRAARHPAGARPRPDRGRRPALDPGQSADLPAARPHDDAAPPRTKRRRRCPRRPRPARRRPR